MQRVDNDHIRCVDCELSGYHNHSCCERGEAEGHRLHHRKLVVMKSRQTKG